MKKFKFSLQSLFEYKETVEKLQKDELSKAQAALRALYEEEKSLEIAFARTEESLDRALKQRTGVPEALAEHDAYFRYLRDEHKKLKLRIQKAEEIRDQCQERLITTMKELKAYKKLRDEQYGRYLKEVQAEDEKVIGDLVSFNTINQG